jgi:hypothetical protein
MYCIANTVRQLTVQFDPFVSCRRFVSSLERVESENKESENKEDSSRRRRPIHPSDEKVKNGPNHSYSHCRPEARTRIAPVSYLYRQPTD